MAYVIYLICVAMNGVLMSHLGLSLERWEYWVSLTLIIVSWISGREYEEKRRNNNTQ